MNDYKLKEHKWGQMVDSGTVIVVTAREEGELNH